MFSLCASQQSSHVLHLSGIRHTIKEHKLMSFVTEVQTLSVGTVGGKYAASF